MARVTAQAIMALVRMTEQDMALLQNKGRAWRKAAVRSGLLTVAAVCLCHISPFAGESYAQEKDTILADSGIIYPGGYDPNTVGDIQGRISNIDIPESGPVRITLTVDQETYIVLASPGWYWKKMDVSDMREGSEIIVRGSKSMGIDGKLYIIAQEIKLNGSKKTIVLRSESGKALWSGISQTGRSNVNKGGYGSSSGGSGSSSSGRKSGSSSGRGLGRNK